MSRVHPSAVVDPSAKLAEDVVIGPFAYIGAGVELHPGVVVQHHASIDGRSTIRERTRIFPYAAIGGEPQDKKFDGEMTRLEIGADNVVREHVTIHVGTSGGGGCTSLGDDNLIMNSAHIAHDVQIGSNCIVASFCGVAGHARIDDYAVLGAFTGVHQFGHVGESVMTAANSMLSHDAPPFAMVAGDRARMVGINAVGLRRREFDRDTIRAIKQAFHIVFGSKLRLDEAVSRVRDEVPAVPPVERLLRFLSNSKRGVCR